VTRSIAAAALACVYVMAVGAFGVADLALGAALGLAIAATWPPLAPSGAVRWRGLSHLPRLLAALTWQILRGGAGMILVTLGLRSHRHLGVIEIPIGERTELGVAVSAFALCLAPGSSLLAIDRARGLLRVHVIDASDAEAFRAEVERFYRVHQRPLFP
jgi:multicomponent K+:H+ antiporter subunit E/multicomponent Na+:H+ antiporter subunit E